MILCLYSNNLVLYTFSEYPTHILFAFILITIKNDLNEKPVVKLDINLKEKDE